MKLGFSGHAFDNLLLLSVIVMIIVQVLVNIIAKKRGVDIKSSRFQLRLGLCCGIIFVIIPGLFSDLPIEDKIIASTLALAGGIANFFAVGRMQKLFKERFIDKKKK